VQASRNKLFTRHVSPISTPSIIIVVIIRNMFIHNIIGSSCFEHRSMGTTTRAWRLQAAAAATSRLKWAKGEGVTSATKLCDAHALPCSF
jgi:hypothetical protein